MKDGEEFVICERLYDILAERLEMPGNEYPRKNAIPGKREPRHRYQPLPEKSVLRYPVSVIAMIKVPFAVVFSGSSASRTAEISTGSEMSLSMFPNFSTHPFGMAVPPLRMIGMGFAILGILSVEEITLWRLLSSLNISSS